MKTGDKIILAAFLAGGAAILACLLLFLNTDSEEIRLLETEAPAEEPVNSRSPAKPGEEHRDAAAGENRELRATFAEVKGK